MFFNKLGAIGFGIAGARQARDLTVDKKMKNYNGVLKYLNGLILNTHEGAMDVADYNLEKNLLACPIFTLRADKIVLVDVIDVAKLNNGEFPLTGGLKLSAPNKRKEGIYTTALWLVVLHPFI